MSKKDKLLAEIGGNVEESTGGPLASHVPKGAGPATPAGRPPKMVGMERSRDVALIELDRIVPDPGQPRKEFTEEKMAELVESLKARGQLQPIRVLWDEGLSRYKILMGERRWRAAKLAGLATLQAVIHDAPLTQAETLELQLVENLVREDLKPIELASTIRKLIDECSYTQVQVAERLRMSQTSVSQALSLLNLPADLRDKVEEGVIPVRTAHHIAKVEGEEEQREVAAEVVSGKLTESETAEVVKKKRAASKASGKGRGAGPGKPKVKVRTDVYHNDSGYKFHATNRKGVDASTLKPALRRWLDSLPDGTESAAS